MSSLINSFIQRFQIDSSYGTVIHRNFKPLYADDSYAQFFGYDDGQAILEMGNLLTLIAPHERDAAWQAYRDIMSGKEKPGIQTYRNIDNEGNELFVLTIDHLIKWQGEPAMQITIVDLSSQFKALNKLNDSEMRYRELVDGSIQGLLVHSNFKPLFCNLAYANMLGFESEKELLAIDSILPLIAEQYHPQAHKDNAALLSGANASIKTDALTKRVDGQPLWLSLISRPIEWNGKQAVQVTAIDVTEQYQLREKLEYRANHDSLTGLINRRTATEIAKYALPCHKADEQPLCCVLIDLDNFKSINDRYGHQTGDEVLQHFAATCQRVLRNTDYISRWGGEEFLLLLPSTTIEQAQMITEHLRRQISESSIRVEGVPLNYTASMGIASLTLEDKGLHNLLYRADKALYTAKQEGKDQIVVANLTEEIKRSSFQ
ncbi:sensor domain-containing diguanylate cyclase [Photobacterium sp. BZF1]|uniref:sensor domain-containing diguanylate cyclase n=1 Tax=Photobacterium sp. BZF1 TaxID=1904457 RepID=UPI001653C88A|nr:sensor domain-containing diguanylate cyclase [Photobacterium sp. BZF1]